MVVQISVWMSAGDDARGKTSELRNTVFKKNREVNVDVKTKASR